MDWTFYVVVGGSLVLAFFVAYMGKRDQRAEDQAKGDE